MKIGGKLIQAFFLTLTIALFTGVTNSYAFTVKNGDTVIEQPDDVCWIQKTGVFYDGRLVTVNAFNGESAENGLSVELSAADLRESAVPFYYTGEIKFYIFVNNTSVFAELTKDDDAYLLKDCTCTLTNTGTEISSSDIRGGDYNPSEDDTLNDFDLDMAETLTPAEVIILVTGRYRGIFNKMLVTYDASGATNPDAGELPGTETPENPSQPETPPEPETPPAEPPATEDQSASEPVPAPTPEPSPQPEEVKPSEPAPEFHVPTEKETVVNQEAPEQQAPEKKETTITVNEQEATQEAKVTDPSSLKRTEVTITGEELKYYVSAVIPAGLDERAVSKLQKQISDTVDSLIGEISDNPSLAKERVSEETYRNIERALSEGKTLSAEVAIESTEKESVPKEDMEVLDAVTKEEEHTNLKIGRYFNISVKIKADDGEELGTYEEMPNTVLFTLPAPKDVPCPAGMEYVIIRIHKGEATIIPVTVNKDGSISFETDRFSAYALAVREVIDEEAAKAAGPISGEDGEDIKDFGKWFLRILVFAFSCGIIVILMGLKDTKKPK